MDRSPVTHGLKPGLSAVVQPHRSRVGGDHDLSAHVRDADPQVTLVRCLHPVNIRRLKLPIVRLLADRSCNHQHIAMPFNEITVQFVRDFGSCKGKSLAC